MRTRIAALWITLITCGTHASWGQGSSSIAILADTKADSVLSALASTLEVRLSQDPSICVLERTEVQRILQEQGVAMAGLSDRLAVIEAGRRLLRAQAFVLLSVEDVTSQRQQPQSRLVRVRVAETEHGLRLWEGYEALEVSQVEAVAERLAEKVRAAISKIGRPNGSVVPVGIVDIHRVQLPEEYEPLVRVLPGLPSARLGKEPRIIMLERESLGTLPREEIASLAGLANAPVKEVRHAFSIRVSDSHFLCPDFVRVVWKSNAPTLNSTAKRSANRRLVASRSELWRL